MVFLYLKIPQEEYKDEPFEDQNKMTKPRQQINPPKSNIKSTNTGGTKKPSMNEKAKQPPTSN